MANTCEAINTIYEEREKFIIIGLTGRTGSGCTTVSKILERKEFKDLDLKEPKTTDFNSNDERKYHIIYNYAKNHWDPFERISMTDMIISFIVQYSFEELNNIFKNIFERDNDLATKIYNELKQLPCKVNYISIGENEVKHIKEKQIKFDKKYDFIYKAFKTCYDKDTLGLLRDYYNSKNPKYIIRRQYELYYYIQQIQNDLREVMKKYTYKYIKRENNKKTRETNNEFTANAYTYFLQQIGNNIRNNGDIFSGDFTGKHMFALARRANDFIKVIKYINTNKYRKPTFICLDAIRNPYEATYFQDRYSAFYLISVNTDDDERKRRLNDNSYEKDEIISLDDIEYPKKLESEKDFTNQNISACCQLGDIYVYNPREDTEEKFFVTQLIVKYVTLIKHPGLITPTHIERCMQTAYNAKLNSGCLSRQVGAVITDESYSIKAVGWNSAAEGQAPCNLRDIENYINNKDYNSFSRFEIEDEKFNMQMKKVYNLINKEKLNGRLYTYCFKDVYEDITGEKNQVHTRSLHAEENAFLQIVKFGGQGIKGGKLFTTASSCVLCSKKAYQLGIKDIYYIDPYPDIAISHILDFGEDKDKKPQTHLFYGAIGRAYTCLYTQRIAIKDELEKLCDCDN